jgi:MFS family permease
LNTISAPRRFGWIETDGRLIIAARALRGFAQSSVTVVVAIYLGLRGFSVVEIGLFLTLGSAGAAVSAVVIGLVGDAFGRRRTLIVLSVLMMLTGIVLATSDDFLLLGAAAFLGSFSALAGSGGGMGTLEQAILAVSAAPEKRTDVFALNSIVGMSAASLGALASGLSTALQRYVGMDALPSLRWLFLGYACVGLLIAVLYGRLSPRIEVADGAARWTNPWRLPSRRRIFTLAGLFAVDSFGTGFVVESLASYWFFTRFGLQPAELGIVFFSSNVLTAVSLWVAARLARRIGLLNTMVFTHIPSSLFLVAMVFAPTAWLAIVFWLLRAFFSQMDVPTSQSYTMAVVGPTERTAMASATLVSRSAGVAAGPTVATALWAVTSATVPFVVAALVKIVYDLTLWTLFRTVKPPEEVPVARPRAAASVDGDG